MNLYLTRTEWRKDGIFGELRDVGGNLVACTLEHSFPGERSAWVPKVREGIYTCVRGLHNLEGRVKKGLPPFETFMLDDVPDFRGEPVKGILFHVGNYDQDSEGCILLGQNIATVGSAESLAHSRDAFSRFMDFQTGLNAFTLAISNG